MLWKSITATAIAAFIVGVGAVAGYPATSWSSAHGVAVAEQEPPGATLNNCGGGSC